MKGQLNIGKVKLSYLFQDPNWTVHRKYCQNYKQTADQKLLKQG
jgi:hypothetical protein